MKTKEKKYCLPSLIYTAALISIIPFTPIVQLSAESIRAALGISLYSIILTSIAITAIFLVKKRTPSHRQLSGAILANTILSPLTSALTLFLPIENYGGYWGNWLLNQLPFSQFFNILLLFFTAIISLNWLFNSPKLFPLNLIFYPLFSKVLKISKKVYLYIYEKLDKLNRKILKKKLCINTQTQPPPELLLSQPPELPKLYIDLDTKTKPPSPNTSKLPSLLAPEHNKPFAPYTEIIIPAILPPDPEMLTSQPKEQHTLRSNPQNQLKNSTEITPTEKNAHTQNPHDRNQQPKEQHTLRSNPQKYLYSQTSKELNSFQTPEKSFQTLPIVPENREKKITKKTTNQNSPEKLLDTDTKNEKYFKTDPYL